MENPLPSIPSKRYFTISEVSKLCGVKPHVLRYWEQEFSQLRPMKRRGNRRYYQLHEVELIRQIRQLLHKQGFTIVGARTRLQDLLGDAPKEPFDGEPALLPWKSQIKKEDGNSVHGELECNALAAVASAHDLRPASPTLHWPLLEVVRQELMDIRELLGRTAQGQ